MSGGLRRAAELHELQLRSMLGLLELCLRIVAFKKSNPEHQFEMERAGAGAAGGEGGQDQADHHPKP